MSVVSNLNISPMDMNEWLAGLNDPQNALKHPPLGVVPGKDVVFDHDRPNSSPFCIIDIKPMMPNPVETPKKVIVGPEATVHPNPNDLIAWG